MATDGSLTMRRPPPLRMLRRYRPPRPQAVASARSARRGDVSQEARWDRAGFRSRRTRPPAGEQQPPRVRRQPQRERRLHRLSHHDHVAFAFCQGPPTHRRHGRHRRCLVALLLWYPDRLRSRQGRSIRSGAEVLVRLLAPQLSEQDLRGRGTTMGTGGLGCGLDEDDAWPV